MGEIGRREDVCVEERSETADVRLAWAGAVGRALGTAGALIGAVCLGLWISGIPNRWSAQGMITMKTNMALALVLAGAALVLAGGAAVTPARRRAAAVAAAAVFAIGALTLVEHLTRTSLGIDQLLATEPAGAPGTMAPNRMGPPGALCLTLLGGALLLLAARRRAASLLAAAAFGVVLVPLVGRVYGIGALFAAPLTGIAWPAVAGLSLVSVAVIFVQPSHGEVPLLWRSDPGGVLLRRTLAPAILVPVGLGLLRLEGERQGLYGTATGTGLLAVSLGAAFVLLLWTSAARLSAGAAERARAERARGASEERLRAVVEHLPSGLIVADLSTGHLVWNREALAIHGYARGDRQHRRVEGLVAEHDLTTLSDEPIPVDRWPLPRLLAGESFRDYELLVRNTRLGWRRVFSYSGVVLPGAEPRIGLLAIVDATARHRADVELRAANERLLDADRRKDEFLSVLSHELRNPLAPIRNSLYILERADPAGDQAARAREVVKRQVSHLTLLVDDLLDVTRIARGKVQLHRADLDLGALVARVGEDHRALLEAKGIALDVRWPDRAVIVSADEARITQVVGNLLQNARKFTDPGGRVVLSTAAERGRAVIRVRDTGIGLDPALRARLFQPFAQAEQTIARSEGGLGLGLSLVKGLAEMHGGEVEVESAGPGEGSEFAVALPLAAAAGPRPSPPEARGARRRVRVLVVDDNVDAARSLADLVRLLGHEVEVAHDGPTAVARAAAHRPEVVLCDLGLPGMSGYDVARALRAAQDGALHLVAVSGYSQPEHVRRALEAGFDDHVSKPPDPERLDRLLA